MRRRARWSAVLMGAALAVSLASVQSTASGDVPWATEGLDPSGVYTYRVTPTGTDAGPDAAALAVRLNEAGFDVSGRSGRTLYVTATGGDRARLVAFGGASVLGADQVVPVVGKAPGDQDPILPARLDGRSYATFYGGYRTVAAFDQFVDDVATAYPSLVKTFAYGQSEGAGRDLRVLCLTRNAAASCDRNPASDTKAQFLVMSQIHARELTTSEMTWRLITSLLDGYGPDATVTDLLQGSEIWIVPQVNPDGIEVSQAGIVNDGFGDSSRAWQRKNTDPGSSACGGPWSSSQRGVDLNRNFASHWDEGGSSDFACDLTYHGASAASESETSSLQALFADIWADQRGSGAAPLTTAGAMVTLHSYSNLVLLPWGYTDTHAPNDNGLRSMAFRMSYFNGYETGQPPEVLYGVSGSTDDWLYDTLGVAAFTYEIGPGSGSCSGFFPAYSCQDGFWALNRPGLLYAAAAARAPYALTLGPTVLSASTSVRPDGRIRIAARADDGAFGSSGVGRPGAQSVDAGRVFLDAPPWEGGTPVNASVTATGTSAQLRATVGAPAQRRLAWVQARDSSGNWGPVRAVYLRPT